MKKVNDPLRIERPRRLKFLYGWLLKGGRIGRSGWAVLGGKKVFGIFESESHTVAADQEEEEVAW